MAKPSLNYVKEGPESIAVGTALYGLFVEQATRGKTQSGVLRINKKRGKTAAQCNRHGAWTIMHKGWADGNLPKRLLDCSIEEGKKLGLRLTPHRIRELIATSHKNWVRGGRKLPNNNRAT